MRLADAIRTHGHLAADIYPLKNRELQTAQIEESAFNLSVADLAEIPAAIFFKDVPANVKNGKDAIDYLKSVYTDKVAFEYNHIAATEERDWIQAQIETGSFKQALSSDEKKKHY